MIKEVAQNCIIHCRVSDVKQLKGGSLEDQENAGRQFAGMKGWNVVKVFKRQHRATVSERQDFDEIKDFIKKSKKPIHFYICRNINRFTRTGILGYSQMKKELSDLGVQMVDTVGTIQTSINTLEHLELEYPWSKKNPSEISEMVQAQNSKEEVTEILTRMIGAEVVLAREGYQVRRPTDGFINKKTFVDGKKKTIEVPDPDRAKFFIKMFELRISGLTDKENVDKINSLGYKTKIKNKYSQDRKRIIGKIGGKPLTVKQLQRIIQRPIYAGIRCEKWTKYQPIKAKYDGLVSIETFNKANKGKVYIEIDKNENVRIIKNKKNYLKSRRNRHNPDYLWKSILCPHCKQPMLGSSSKGKSGKGYKAYHCGGAKSGKRSHKYFRVSKDVFDKAVEHYIDELRFQDGFLNSFNYVLTTKYRKREKKITKEAGMVNQNVADLKISQSSKMDAFEATSSPIIREKLEKEIEDLEVQIKQAEENRNKVEITEKSIKSFIKQARFIMEHPAEILKNLKDWRARQAILGLIFEETPTYEEIVNGTPKLTPVFKLSEDFKVDKSLLVTLRGIEPRFAE
jgi:site-specific DNA recombinase